MSFKISTIYVTMAFYNVLISIRQDLELDVFVEISTVL